MLGARILTCPAPVCQATMAPPQAIRIDMVVIDMEPRNMMADVFVRLITVEIQLRLFAHKILPS